MSQHTVPRHVYYLVFATLLLLTLITVEVSFYNLGILSFHVALLIASIKACLVVLYFMHVRYEDGLIRLVVLTGLAFLCIMLLFSLADIFTRQWDNPPSKEGFALAAPPSARSARNLPVDD
ncbi:MAG: hypothetical protein Kow00109_11380 [Acidobacteriota bacterium]